MRSVPRCYKQDSWNNETAVNMTLLARASSSCKRQPVREGAPHEQIRSCLTNKNLVFGPRCDWTPRQTGRLTVGHNINLTLTLNELVVRQSPAGKNVSTEAEDIVRVHHQTTPDEDISN
jgi:hypothetical protein